MIMMMMIHSFSMHVDGIAPRLPYCNARVTRRNMARELMSIHNNTRCSSAVQSQSNKVALIVKVFLIECGMPTMTSEEMPLCTSYYCLIDSIFWSDSGFVPFSHRILMVIIGHERSFAACSP